MARPRKPVEIKRVIELASKGLTMNEIAALENISDDTLHRHYAEAIEKGRKLCTASLRKRQFDLAIDGNPTMLIWLGKQLLGQADRQEITGNIQHGHIDLTGVAIEQLREFKRILEADGITTDGERTLQA